MKISKYLVSLVVVGGGLYAISTSAMQFTQVGFSELAKPVEEEAVLPEFTVSEDAVSEGYEIMEEALDELSVSCNESIYDNGLTLEDESK